MGKGIDDTAFADIDAEIADVAADIAVEVVADKKYSLVVVVAAGVSGYRILVAAVSAVPDTRGNIAVDTLHTLLFVLPPYFPLWQLQCQ